MTTLPLSLRGVAAAALLASLPLTFLGQETIDSVTYPNGAYAPEYWPFNADGEGLAADVEVTYPNTGGSNTSGTYRLEVQLLDNTGTPQFLEVTSGVATTQIFEINAGNALTIPPGGLTRTELVELFPSNQLDPTKTYRVRATLQQYLLGYNGSFFYFDWFDQNSRNGNLQTFYHFQNSQDDGQLNVIGRNNSNAFTKNFALQTDLASDTFKANVSFTLYRFDVTGFYGVDTQTVPLRYELELIESGTGNSIPLVNSTLFDSASIDAYFNTGSKLIPRIIGLNRTIEVEPAAQLDPVNRTYQLRVTLRHDDGGLAGLRTWNETGSSYTRLLDMNGSLRFADVTTTMRDISDSSFFASATLSGARVQTSLQVFDGVINGFPDHTYASIGSLDFEIDSAGTSYIGFFEAVNVSYNGPGDDLDVLGKTRFRRSNIVLDGSGARSDFEVLLPTGSGWRYTGSARRDLNAFLPVTTGNLNASLQPELASYNWSFVGSPVYVVEETKPLDFEVDNVVWDTSGNGTFTFNAYDAVHTREKEYVALETDPNLPPSLRYKLSNDQYFRHVDGGPLTNGVIIEASSGTVALLSTEFNFQSGAFRTHFPYDVAILHSGGYLQIKDDLPEPGSLLFGVNEIAVRYQRDCTGADCGGSIAGDVIGMTNGSGELFFTPDGGLHYPGAVLLTGGSYTRDLEWGYRPADSSFAHATTEFSAGQFYMPGHFLRGDHNPHGDDDGPGVILNSGVAETNSSILHRPYTGNYIDGPGDYAGANLRVTAPGAVSGESWLGDYFTGPYPLDGQSKYYVREGGVNGIHAPRIEFFPLPTVIYGYDILFDYMGLNFLDSTVRDSRTDGNVDLPYPSNFAQDFEEMKFNCFGGLTRAEVPDENPQKLMEYWLATLDVFALAFERDPALVCNPDAGTLVLGIGTDVNYVDQTLYGRLAYLPDGNLVTPADSLNDSSGVLLTSRLRLPNVLRINGPLAEVYTYTICTEAYFNEWWDIVGNPRPYTLPATGFINYAGKLDVPFFKDLRAHVQVSANVTGIEPPLNVAGGWSEGGNTYWTNVNFDPNHRAFPGDTDPGGTVYNFEYLDGGNSAVGLDKFLVVAEQEWLGIVTFSYPLKWNNASRSFTSFEEIRNDFAVVSAEHKVIYLSAERAELSFGLAYEGLPRINLASAIIDKIEEESGALEALVSGVSQQVVGDLVTGVDSFAALLNDRMRDFYASIFEDIFDPVTLQIYNDLVAAYNDAGIAPEDFETAFPAILDERLLNSTQSVRQQLKNAFTTLGEVGNVMGEIDSRLEDVQQALRVVIGARIASDGTIIPEGDPTAVANTIEGILTKDGSGNYQFINPLVKALLREIAPNVADNLVAILGPTLDGLNAELNALVENARPTLEEVRTALTEIDQFIEEVQQRVTQPAGEFVAELQQIVDDASTEIDSLTTSLRNETLSFLQTTLPDKNQFQQYSEAEIREFILREIEDRFFASAFVAQIQVAIKQRIYDVQTAFNEAVDTAFQSITLVLKEAVSEAFSAVDDTINGALDELRNILGTAQLDGYAYINGDSLKLLRIDLFAQFKIPDNFEFHAFLQIKELDSDGPEGCYVGADTVTEVTLGALNIPVNWGGANLYFDVGTKFTFGGGKLRGAGGFFALTSGNLGFESFSIFDMRANVMFGRDENYLAAGVQLQFESYNLEGGIFFGRTCTIDPLVLVDPDVAEVLGDPPFTGAYAYGQGYFPVFGGSCVFNISAGVGAGAFYFVEGPTYGGKMYLAVGGEALCVVSIKGEVTLIGLKAGNDLRFNGKGRLSGKVGPCPFCIKFGKTAKVKYINSDWQVDL